MPMRSRRSRLKGVVSITGYSGERLANQGLPPRKDFKKATETAGFSARDGGLFEAQLLESLDLR
jgi:hypothetical protein